MEREVQGGGHKRPRIFRPLGDGFWPDVIFALSLLAGFALGGLLFDDFAVLYGAAVGATALVIVRAVRRRVKRHEDPGPRA